MKEALGARWTTALGGLVVASLALVGIWQLRWIDAWSASEAERMRRFAATGVDRVALDIERSLGGLDALLRQASGTPQDELGERLLAITGGALEAQAPLAHILWIDPRNGGSTLEVLPAEADIAPVVWEDGLEDWRGVPGDLLAPSSSSGLRLPPWPPAVLTPLLAGGAASSEHLHYVLVLLDPGELRAGLLGDLVERHLGQAFDGDMRVLVTHGGRTVLDTHPELPLAGGADAERSAAGGRLSIGGGASGHEFSIELGNAADTVAVYEVEAHETTGADPLAGVRPEVVEAGEATVVEIPAWRVRAQHVAGSIDAAIASTRRRNFTLGLGILGVLGGAAILLVLAAGRARRLAARQVEFVAGVTHELRTPLAVIRSAAENLRDCVVTEPEHAQRYGEMIHEEARRLGDFVERALTLAGAHSSAPTRSVDLAPLLAGAVERCRRSAGTEQRIDLDVPRDLPAARAEPASLTQALDNLLANAVKYGGDPAQVGVRARAAGDRIDVTVWDRGPGIPPEERKRLFEPFFRGRDARSSQLPGSGLGLAVVRRAMECQGGSVSVEAAEGAGCAFTLHLRVAHP